MNWKSLKKTPPKPKDSPIIVWGKDRFEDEDDHCAVMTWVDASIWMKPGWYEWSGARLYSQMDEMIWWDHIPNPPKENHEERS